MYLTTVINNYLYWQNRDDLEPFRRRMFEVLALRTLRQEFRDFYMKLLTADQMYRSIPKDHPSYEYYYQRSLETQDALIEYYIRRVTNKTGVSLQVLTEYD